MLPSLFSPFSRGLVLAAVVGLAASPGALAQASLVSDIDPGADDSSPQEFAEAGGVPYFVADDGPSGQELWSYDPVSSTASLVADIHPGSGSSQPASLAEAGGRIYFRANDGITGSELWSYDPGTGTASLVADIYAGMFGSSPADLIELRGQIYFRADDGTSGEELWSYVLPPALAAELDGAEGYRMLAHPAGGTADDLLGSTYTQGFPGSDDPAPADGFCSVYTYDETLGSFDDGYVCLDDQSGAIARGTGVFAYIYEDEDPATAGVQVGFPKVLEITGLGASTPFSAFPITNTNGATTPAYQEGWNLLGNPLADGFNWNNVTRSASLDDAVYVYDPNYLSGDFRSWTAGVGGDLTEGVVPALQGFFVKANAPGATMEIPNGAVVPVDVDVYGLAGEAPDPLRLELALDADGSRQPVSVSFLAVAEGAALGPTRTASRRTHGHARFSPPPAQKARGCR